VETIRRIGHNRVDAVVFLPLQPVEAIGMEERRATETDGVPPFLSVEELLLNAAIRSSLDSV
jgi:hypothetical protein